MSTFPPQLPWRRFVWVLRDLGYRPLKSRRGSLRQFFCPTRKPNFISFHEPHTGESLHKRALCDCLRRLQLTTDEFAQLLGGIDNIEVLPKTLRHELKERCSLGGRELWVLSGAHCGRLQTVCNV